MAAPASRRTTKKGRARDFLAGLTERQREAARHIDGPLLIVAGPGSGKTRVMAHRVAYLIGEVGVPPYRILAVTFTNKAARELRERCERLLGPGGIERGLQVRTFHSFCAQLLRLDGGRAGLDPGFSIYDADDQFRLMRNILDEMGVDTKKNSPRAVLSVISDAKNVMLDGAHYEASAGSYFEQIVARAFPLYEQRLRGANAVDFDDLLLLAHRILEGNPDVLDAYRQRYEHLLVDEFQDTNAIQFGLARLLAAEHRNICVVGDPNQSIYSWRHADPRNMFDFQKVFTDAKVVSLDQNYRSTQTIIEAATALISNNEGRLRNELWTENDRGAPIVVAEAYTENDEAELVLRESLRLVEDEKYDPGEIAVMYRINAQSRALEVSCNRHSTPYQLVGGLKFYERREIRDVIAYLRVIANPPDDVALERIINVPARGISQKSVDAIRSVARSSGHSMWEVIASADDDPAVLAGRINPRAVKSVGRFSALIKHLADSSHSHSPMELIDLALERSGYKQLIQDDDERGDERWENILELRGSAEPYDGPEPREHLLEFLENAALVSDVDSMADPAEGPSMTLITLHQAKGLEFDAVFIVGMEEGLLPHVRSLESQADLEEERRLCYVGMTRARKRLYMLRSFRRAARGFRGATLPSRFLGELPRSLIQDASTRRPDPRRGEVFRTPAEMRQAATVPAAPSAAPREAQFADGDRVRHSHFGEGIVVSSKEENGGVELTVAFEDEGVKRLDLNFARLERVEKSSSGASVEAETRADDILDTP